MTAATKLNNLNVYSVVYTAHTTAANRTRTRALAKVVPTANTVERTVTIEAHSAEEARKIVVNKTRYLVSVDAVEYLCAAPATRGFVRFTVAYDENGVHRRVHLAHVVVNGQEVAIGYVFRVKGVGYLPCTGNAVTTSLLPTGKGFNFAAEAARFLSERAEREGAFTR